MRLGYVNDGHAELAGRRAAVEYLIGGTRAALSAANDYFMARDAQATADRLDGQRRPSRLSLAVYDAHRMINECDKYSRGDGFGL